MGQTFSENKRETLERVDSQIAELHNSVSLHFMPR